MLLNSLSPPPQSLCCPLLLGQKLWFCLLLLLGFLLLKQLLQGERLRSLCFHCFFTLFFLLSSKGTPFLFGFWTPGPLPLPVLLVISAPTPAPPAPLLTPAPPSLLASTSPVLAPAPTPLLTSFS